MRGFLGLGSNEGDPLAALRAARDALGPLRVRVTGSSSVYVTAPQGEVLDQADFLNACLEVDTELSPEELLGAAKAVEAELGREPGGPRHGPRPIDVDVLLLGDIEHRSDRLVLPHGDIAARRFVLEPLLELDPSLTLPDGTAIGALLEEVAGQRVQRGGPL